MAILFLIPKNLLSRLVGWLVHLKLPISVRAQVIGLFAKKYKINLQEAEKPISEYLSIGDFFTRKLKPDLRPVTHLAFCHPADSVINQAGAIRQGQLIQAKGLQYTASQFLGSEPEAQVFYEGGAFATYYLCPTDYHRVHSPIQGKIWRIRHIPGNLWPVNSWSVGRIKNLFSINERVVVQIKTPRGHDLSLVFVGATNVGMISMDSVWKGLRTNLSGVTAPRVQSFKEPLSVTKASELGIFHMGSTVVLLFSQGALRELGVDPKSLENKMGAAVKMGQGL